MLVKLIEIQSNIKLILSCHVNNVRVLEADKLDDLPKFASPEVQTARRSSEPKTDLETLGPAALTKLTLNLVKKALLPKIKYHWDQGFKQVSWTSLENKSEC